MAAAFVHRVTHTVRTGTVTTLVHVRARALMRFVSSLIWL